MPRRSREAYVAAGKKAGDDVRLVVVPDAGHFEVIAPTTAAWAIVRDQVLELAGALR
jgi:pimeloyl-ACP methyl ester carboxylesterase